MNSPKCRAVFAKRQGPADMITDRFAKTSLWHTRAILASRCLTLVLALLGLNTDTRRWRKRRNPQLNPYSPVRRLNKWLTEGPQSAGALGGADFGAPCFPS